MCDALAVCDLDPNVVIYNAIWWAVGRLFGDFTGMSLLPPKKTSYRIIYPTVCANHLQNVLKNLCNIIYLGILFLLSCLLIDALWWTNISWCKWSKCCILKTEKMMNEWICMTFWWFGWGNDLLWLDLMCTIWFRRDFCWLHSSNGNCHFCFSFLYARLLCNVVVVLKNLQHFDRIFTVQCGSFESGP